MRILRFGSRGPAVQLLQLALVRAGFGPLARDGLFGAATQAALRRFQTANGLAVDAVAGAETHRALLPWYTGYLLHRIRRGDSFYALAMRYGSSVAAIAAANPDYAANNLPVGAQLVIPLDFAVVPTEVEWFSELTALCLRGLAARYPFLVTGSVGKSVLGRPLWSLRLGRGENRVLYAAAQHANEWITAPLLLRFAEELCAAFNAGGELYGVSAAQILDYCTLCLVPVVNPDGVDLVTGELTSGDAYERARELAAAYPRFAFPDGWKANLAGVDLNLQYPAGWEQARENKFAQGVRSPAPADFVGEEPLQAPEARALYDLTLRFDPALVQAWHTQGEVIYWRYLDIAPPGAEQIAALFAEVSDYRAEDAPFASGFAGFKDWFIQDFGRPGFTVEAGRGVNPLPLRDLAAIYGRTVGILTLGTVVT